MAPFSGKSEAVVLRTFDLRERDLIVVLLTRGAGKIRGVARGARQQVGQGSPVGGAEGHGEGGLQDH